MAAPALAPLVLGSPDDERAATHRRTVRALVLTQVAGGAGLAAGITVAALLAVELGGSTAAAGLPEAVAVAGTGLATMPLALLMQRRGRRAGLRLGWLGGAAGAAGVVVAAVVGSLALLLVAMLALGAANAASDASRHVATDLATDRTAGRAIGTVVAATAVSTALGPAVAGPASTLAAHVGLPAMTGPFLLAALAFLAAAVVVTVALRPDPLLLAVAPEVVTPVALGAAPVGDRPSVRELLRRPDVRLAAVATATANATMLGLMVLAPLHLAAGATDHAAHLGTVGPVISLHVAAMFAPSPLTGRLVDAVGARRVLVGGASTIGTAGLVTATAAPTDVGLLAAGLVLLGLGWNGCFVAGARLVAGAVAPTDRPRAQGVVDTAGSVAAVLAGAAAGVVADLGGVVAAGLLVAVAAAALVIATTRRQARPVPAS